jgi:anti-sigma B factor antagonist
MNYSISEKYNTVILTFKGKMMGGPHASDFQNEIAGLIEIAGKPMWSETSAR